MWFEVLLTVVLVIKVQCSSNRIPDPPIIELYNNTSINFKDDAQITVLHNYGSHLLLGGRNAVYNVSLERMEITWSYIWPTSRKSYDDCALITNANCHNFIRSFYIKSQSRIVFCGTHGRNPTCKEFEIMSSKSYKEFEGVGLSPFLEDQSNPFLYSNGQIFTVNVPEYSGTDAILLRLNTSKTSNMLRTARRESVFDNARIVALERSNKELFTFFAETPSEREEYGQRRVARVARVCMDDPGAEYHKDEWSSFAKARIECGIKEPDMNTLYFNLLVAVSPAHDYFVGAFRSQLAALNGSALCLFKRSVLTETFRSAFQSSNKLSTCARAVSRDEQTKLRGKPLISSNIFSTPVFHYYGNDLFTAVTVEEDVQDLNGETYDVWYIGTNLGHILKVWFSHGKAHHFVTFKFLKESTPIKSIFIHREHLPTASKDTNVASYLIIQTENKLVRLPTTACFIQNTCSTCLAFHDPSCAWVSHGSDCVNIHENKHRRSLLTQSACEKVEKIRRMPPATTAAPICSTQIIEHEIVKARSFDPFFQDVRYLFFFTLGLLVGGLCICIANSCKKARLRLMLEKPPAPINPYYKSVEGMSISRASSNMMTSSRSTYC